MVLGCALSQNQSSEATVQSVPFSVGALCTKTYKLSQKSANPLGTVLHGCRGEQIRVLSLREYCCIKDNILTKNSSKLSARGSPSMKTYAPDASPPPGSEEASFVMDVPVSQHPMGLGLREAKPLPRPLASLLPPSDSMMVDEWRRRLPKRKTNDGGRKVLFRDDILYYLRSRPVLCSGLVSCGLMELR